MSDAEIVEALNALAVENDEVDAVVSGGEHRAPLLRLAASRLAEIAAENERMRQALEEIEQTSRDHQPFETALGVVHEIAREQSK